MIGRPDTTRRPVAVYIGSSADLTPALFYPEYDWVFITSDGTGYWSCHYRLETMEGFVTALNEQLPAGARVTCDGKIITCHRIDTSRIATIFYATKFPEISERCRAAIFDARVLWMNGHVPDVSALRSLCPRLTDCFVNGGTWESSLRDLRLVETPNYDVYVPGIVYLFAPSAQYHDFRARAKRSGWDYDSEDDEGDEQTS